MNFGKSWNKLGRKGHRWERRQPHHRKHLGFLEHKKDYTARAKLFHKKQDELQRLRLLAALRNPDEFHSDMAHAKVSDGKVVIDAAKRRGKRKTRDLHALNSRFLTMRVQHEKGKLKRELRALNCTDASCVPDLVVSESSRSASKEEVKAARRRGNKGHIVFVDSDEKRSDFDASKHFGTPRALVSQTQNRLRTQQLMECSVGKMSYIKAKDVKKRTILNYWKAQARVKKVTQFENQLKRTQLKKKLCGKDKVLCYRKRDVSSGRVVKKRYKWPKIRKR